MSESPCEVKNATGKEQGISPYQFSFMCFLFHVLARFGAYEEFRLSWHITIQLSGSIHDTGQFRVNTSRFTTHEWIIVAIAFG